MLPPTTTAVLFDLDDTLLEYGIARDRGVVAWVASVDPGRVARYGEAELARRWLELERHHFARYSAGELTFAEQRRERIRAFWPERFDDDAATDAAFDDYLTCTAASWAPVPGVVETVTALAERLPVGVLTNGHPSIQQAKLDRLGLGWARLFASADLPAPKPHRLAFWTACEALGVTPSQTVIMVGDDPTNDIAGARDAGLGAIWFRRDGDVLAGAFLSAGGSRPAAGTVDSPVPTITDLRQLLSPVPNDGKNGLHCE